MKVLMGLYGSLESDSRVLRSIDAVSDIFDVVVFPSAVQPCFSLKDAKILRRSDFTISKNKIFDHIHYHLTFLKLICTQKPDIVYVHDYYLCFLGWIAKRLYRKKVIYDAHELIIDKSFITSKRDWFYKGLEKFSIPSFDLVIAANEERLAKMICYYPFIYKSAVIKNIPNSSIVYDIYTHSEILRQFPDINFNKRIILYQGVVSPRRALHKIFDRLIKFDDFRVVVLGSGEEKYVNNLKNRYPNIYFLGKVDLKTVYSFIKLSDFGIISYFFGDLNNIYCAPNKLYEYAEFNLPMITTSQELFRRTFNDYPIGICINDNTSNNQLHEFLNSSVDDAIFSRFKIHNNWDIEKQKLQKVLKSVIS